ncbi:MAG TPA: cytochrome c oxidase subunit II [Candidatus Limnocylindria bacterium]|nr:cytochrome c oxidase subunit II [Candidatus Limnocylindria bacterium]
MTACEGRFSALDPGSPEARGIANLTWFMFALAAGVMALVTVLLLAALWRGRRSRELPESRLNGILLVVGGGIVLPLLVLPVLWVLTLQGMAALAQPDGPAELEIEIRGRQYSYEVLYPASGVQLTDEVRIPTGRPVLLRLHGDDVIHSFWVPRLSGKTDLIPGVVNEAWIRAESPGTYEGRCAEYCGVGHTEMGLTVIAQTPEEFEAWLAEHSP